MLSDLTKSFVPVKNAYESKHRLSIVESSTAPFATRSIISLLALFSYCCQVSQSREYREASAIILQTSSSGSSSRCSSSSGLKHHIGCLWQYLKYRSIAFGMAKGETPWMRSSYPYLADWLSSMPYLVSEDDVVCAVSANEALISSRICCWLVVWIDLKGQLAELGLVSSGVNIYMFPFKMRFTFSSRSASLSLWYNYQYTKRNTSKGYDVIHTG